MKRHRHVVPNYISPTFVPNAMYMMLSTLGASPIVVLISFLCCWYFVLLSASKSSMANTYDLCSCMYDIIYLMVFIYEIIVAEKQI